MPKLLLDENIGRVVTDGLRKNGYEVESVLEISPGTDDASVLKLAAKKNAILVTLDRDFGYLVFVKSRRHTGVIYIRLTKESSTNILKVLLPFLDQYADKSRGKFTTLTEGSVRMK